MREEVWRDGLDKDPVMVPEEVKLWVFSNDNISSSDDLVCQGGDMRVSLAGNEPEIGRKAVEVLSLVFLLEMVGKVWAIERNLWLPW